MYYPLIRLDLYLDQLVLGSQNIVSVYKIGEDTQKLHTRIVNVPIYTIALFGHRLSLAYNTNDKKLFVKDLVFGRCLEVREKSNEKKEDVQILKLAKENEWLVKVSLSGRYIWIYQIENSHIIYSLYRGYHSYQVLDILIR